MGATRMTASIHVWRDAQQAQSLEWFRTLQAMPETGFEEHRTAAYVASVVGGLGLEVMHLKVDLFDKFLLQPRFAWWHKTTLVLTALVFALLAWTFLGKSMDAARFSEVSQGLNIPRAPLYGWMAACSALSALAALYTAFAAPISIARDQEELL